MSWQDWRTTPFHEDLFLGLSHSFNFLDYFVQVLCLFMFFLPRICNTCVFRCPHALSYIPLFVFLLSRTFFSSFTLCLIPLLLYKRWIPRTHLILGQFYLTVLSILVDSNIDAYDVLAPAKGSLAPAVVCLQRFDKSQTTIRNLLQSRRHPRSTFSLFRILHLSSSKHQCCVPKMSAGP
jgi:hypothetical protein